MADVRTLLIVISDAAREPWAHEVGAACGAEPLVFWGSPAQAAEKLSSNSVSPSHLVLDIGTRGADILTEIDQLAQQCEAGTRVIAVGDTNDIGLYRALIGRGVLEYLPMPADPREVARLLTAPPAAAPVAEPAPAPAPILTRGGEKQVISFFSAASGDGASTAALNSAYALSQLFHGRTVLVDMDYQFGMVAKHLDLQNQYGIRDLFDHPDRGVDPTLIRRMVASYGDLHVITAPADLKPLPIVAPEVIRDLIATLKQSYDFIILDLPHVWLPWIATIAQESTQIVLVSQLWLKSVSHSARMMKVLRELSIPVDRVVNIINRSGAKFKEAIDVKDFERVCGAPIDYTLANDIKTITTAEAAARSVLEIEDSELAGDIMALARGLGGLPAESRPTGTKPGGLLSSFLKRG